MNTFPTSAFPPTLNWPLSCQDYFPLRPHPPLLKTRSHRILPHAAAHTMNRSVNLLLFVTVVACAASSVTGSVLVAALLTLAVNKPREPEQLNNQETRLYPRVSPRAVDEIR